jgi:diphosphomevalonate decarboxylase
MTTAIAHPNIALVKYWGKQNHILNYPASPSLSITLDSLITKTKVSASTETLLMLNGKRNEDLKVAKFLDLFREKFELPPVSVETDNNFPTGAGLASSASGFAALVTALNENFQLGLSLSSLSEWARRGSASAARSIFGGFVTLQGPNWRADQLAKEPHWDLEICIVVINEGPKKISSTTGMKTSEATSPFYLEWIKSADSDFEIAKKAIIERDFVKLSEVSEQNCLKMHSVMHTSQPAISYWAPGTVLAMELVREIRSTGTPAFFTMDAGPQVKVIYPKKFRTIIQKSLEELKNVRLIWASLGPGAHLI